MYVFPYSVFLNQMTFLTPSRQQIVSWVTINVIPEIKSQHIILLDSELVFLDPSGGLSRLTLPNKTLQTILKNSVFVSKHDVHAYNNVYLKKSLIVSIFRERNKQSYKYLFIYICKCE